MKKMAYCFWSVILGIPFGLATLMVLAHSWVCGVAAFLMMFVLVAFVPFCHRHENLWMFILTTFSWILVNGALSSQIVEFMYAGIYPMWMNVLLWIEIFLIFVSVENVLTGLLTRMFWKKQRDLVFPE